MRAWCMCAYEMSILVVLRQMFDPKLFGLGKLPKRVGQCLNADQHETLL